MFIWILSATLFGIILGTLTGIIPGLHINLISVILLSISGYFLSQENSLILSVLIVSIALTHTFVNILPSLFLGVPDEANALAILPAHKMLLKGLGYNAIKLTVIGSLLSLILVIMLLPVFILILPYIFHYIKDYIGWGLIGISIFMILKEKTLNKKFFGVIVFFLSGILGMIVLTDTKLTQPLLPMLAGLFGVSNILLSLKSKAKIPVQRNENLVLEKKETAMAVITSALSGSFTGIFPALGSSQASIISMQVLGEIKDKYYLVLLGGINTANFVFSLITLYSINKARNGSVVAISKLTSLNLGSLILLLSVVLLSGAFATCITLLLGRTFANISSRLNYKLLSLIVIVFVILLTLYFSSLIGLVILIVSTAIGIIPSMLGVKRSISMGCLILPVIFFYL